MKTEFVETVAPDGQIWVCHACGKTARDRYNLDYTALGWDESCMLNCALHDEDRLNRDAGNGRVISIKSDEDME